MRKLLFTCYTTLLMVVTAYAQPSNNECDNPIVITDVTAFCTESGAFTNVGATPTNFNPVGCPTENDVWFSFTALSTDVNITIRGATQNGAGGTLKDPEVSLHFGNCGGLLETIECASSTPGSNIAELYQGGLFVGSTYLIRVQGGGGQVGSFQLCLNNYNPPVDPKSDCPQASILCDKSPFVVQNVTGAGNDNSELDGADCFSNGSSSVNNESNSTWFVWTCSVAGPLTFTLTPNNGPDDLDFVIYELPNGVSSGTINCAGRQIVRCMASGESSGVNSAPCLGPTGLRTGDPDTSEDAGCSNAGDDAWLAPLQMEVGKTYALCVNNFSLSGNGFGVEFGGTGEFQGPDAMFTTIPNAICLGETVQVVDQSTFNLGSITKWQWSFGAEATPLIAVGKGPHFVKFEKSGFQPVVLTVTTNLGCKVTHVQYVNVFPDVTVDTLIAAPDCNGGSNGAITINNIKSGTPPYKFSWNNGPFTTDNTLTGLTIGVYNLVISDSNNCTTELDINVKELELTVAPDIQKPLCTGDANGQITLNVTNGQAPYQFNWGSGFEVNNTKNGFSAGVYTVLGIDAELCKGTFMVTVTDNPPVTLDMDTIDVTCYKLNDGIGIANPGGGVGNFTYLWSDNQIDKEAINLAPGVYTVTASDGNDCTIVGGVSIVEPPELDIQLVRTKDLLCAGLPTGEIEVSASGGRPNYEYTAVGNIYQPSNVLTGLYAGNYWAKVRDESGCVDSVFAKITEPLAVTLFLSPTDVTIDLGYTVQTVTATGPAGRPVSFAWTPSEGLSCTDCPEPLITAIGSQLYLAKITDADGCMDTATIRLTVNKQRPIYFPNIFDPSTGVFPNNFFTGFSGPAATAMKVFRVYDRWGALVFEGKNIPFNAPNEGWDGTINGKNADTGVYVWYASVQFIDGVEQEYSGDITVIR
jgi:hypothetical protein